MTHKKSGIKGMPLTPSEWKKRRFRLDISLCIITILCSYIIFFGEDNAMNTQALLAMIAAGTSLLGSYIFAAVWDDGKHKKAVVEYNQSVTYENNEGEIG